MLRLDSKEEVQLGSSKLFTREKDWNSCSAKDQFFSQYIRMQITLPPSMHWFNVHQAIFSLMSQSKVRWIEVRCSVAFDNGSLV